MSSQINPNDIDGTYPVAGQANNTQGFRDNFTNIKTNFQYAEDEITDLQSKAVLKSALAGTTLDNNMSDNLIYAVKLNDLSYTYLQNTATTGTITLDYSASNYQYVSTTGSVSLGFSNWPASGSTGVLNFTINVTNVAHTLTLPAGVNVGLFGIQGISPGTPGVSNTITFGITGQFTFRFTTSDSGASISVFDFSRGYDKFYSTVEIQNSTVSTSPTTGALQVDGGVGIVGNLNLGGNLITYTSTGNTAFSATTDGFVHINAPLVPANVEGAFSIVGTSDGAYQPVVNPGGLFHVTAADNQGVRLLVDSFGTGNLTYPALINRRGRGTAASPAAIQAGDIISRIAATGWGNVGFVLAAGNASPTGIDFISTETYTTANAGSQINFYTSPIGAVTRTLSANITANITSFPGAVSAVGNITGGNITTGAISLSGNVISNLNVTGNITGGNVTTVGLMSTTGNVNAGNIIGTATISCLGNITTTGNLFLNDGGTMGYTAGAGGTVTQGGNKSTGVTLNKPSGEITMQNTNLANDATASFTLTNSTISARDLLLINLVGGGTAGAYTFGANCTTGSAIISVTNRSGGTLGEAIVLRYAVIRGSIA